MSDYAQLKADVAAYMHRSDLNGQVPSFIEKARLRINRDLRVREMVRQLDFSPADNPFTLPPDLLEVRQLTHGVGNRRVEVKSASPETIALYTIGTAGGPLFYLVRGLEMETQPGGIGVDMRLSYYGEVPELVNDTDTNDVLDTHYTIWLNGALIEGHTFTQDRDLRADALDAYTSEVMQANGQSKWTEAPENMKGASIWL